ncbi:YciI family protein [Pinibacter aurantiacus]|uniref:Transcription initiation protein n=1 Tax=Pinibacter aurantiacus TaxID=2851599 RepID=A0A9E2W5R8_9BACT|nr:YciI family protein [Pinibacter aurantiacus]MBV4358953.1 transcription initiation protein [Pinibacter aurantiacus]
MKEFLLIFRRDFITKEEQPSPEQIQNMMKPWQDWMGSLAAQNKLASSGNRLASDGRVVKSDKIVTDGPYVEIKEAVGGYIVVKANDLDEAAELAKGCPVLNIGGNVEVRGLVGMD